MSDTFNFKMILFNLDTEIPALHFTFIKFLGEGRKTEREREIEETGR